MAQLSHSDIFVCLGRVFLAHTRTKIAVYVCAGLVKNENRDSNQKKDRGGDPRQPTHELRIALDAASDGSSKITESCEPEEGLRGKEKSENHQLHRNRRGRILVDILRQKCDKKERDLGIHQIHQEAVSVGSPECVRCCCLLHAGMRRGDGLICKIEQVACAYEFQSQKGLRRLHA